MKRQTLLSIVYIVGALAMLAGLFTVTVTIATNDYTPYLRCALGLAGIAAVCFVVVAVMGTPARRALAALSLIPVFYVALNALGRGAI